MPSHDLLCPDNGYFTVLLFFTSGFWRDRSSRSGTGVLLFNFLYHSWVRTLMSVQMKAFALRILFGSNVLLSTKPCLHILCCTKHLNVMTSGWRNFPVSLFWRTCGFSLFIFFFCLILTLYVKRLRAFHISLRTCTLQAAQKHQDTTFVFCVHKWNKSVVACRGQLFDPCAAGTTRDPQSSCRSVLGFFFFSLNCQTAGLHVIFKVRQI